MNVRRSFFRAILASSMLFSLYSAHLHWSLLEKGELICDCSCEQNAIEVIKDLQKQVNQKRLACNPIMLEIGKVTNMTNAEFKTKALQHPLASKEILKLDSAYSIFYHPVSGRVQAISKKEETSLTYDEDSNSIQKDENICLIS